MKYILFTYLTGISMCIACTAYTQTSTKSAKLPSSIEQTASSREEGNDAIASGSSHYLNNINPRAVREFTKEYKDVADVKWLHYDKGFVASFTKDSVNSRIYYTQRGDLEVVIRYYFENRLSPDIRRLVRSKYYDYSIYQISETSGNGQTIYFIKINDKTFWKTLRIINEEIEVLQEYSSFSSK